MAKKHNGVEELDFGVEELDFGVEELDFGVEELDFGSDDPVAPQWDNSNAYVCASSGQMVHRPVGFANDPRRYEKPKVKKRGYRTR